MNIYDVDYIENKIESIAADNGGEIPEELLGQLVIAETKCLDQIESWCKYIKELDCYSEMCVAEINKIKRKQEIALNRIKSIKKYLLPYIEKRGKLSTGFFKISLGSSESVDVYDDVPIEYKKTNIEIKVDKEKIKKDLKNGIEVPGARLIKSKYVRIK